MKTKVIFGIMFVLMIGCALGKNYSVSVDISPKEQTVNPYEIAVYDITIENKGKNGTYNISVEGIPKDWYSLSHDSIYLESGKKNVYLFITPQYSDKDVYIANLTVDGVSEQFKLNIVKDHKVMISMPSEIKSCLCEETTISILIENKGKYKENLNLELSGNGVNIVDLEIESFVLEPNETKIIPVKIEKLCNTEERNYNLLVHVKSTNSYASSSGSTLIKKIKCFEFSLEYPQEVRTCGGIIKPFNISLTNTGLKEDSYEIKIQDLGYSDIVKLKPMETQDFEVNFFKEKEGISNITFTVSSETTQKQGIVKFIVEKCYGVDLELDTKQITIQSGTGKLTKPVVRNMGTRENIYEIKSNATWVAIRPEKLVLNPNETQDIFVYYSPEYGASGIFDVQISVESEAAFDREVVRVNVGHEKPLEINETTTTVETTPETTKEEIPTPPEVNITKPSGMLTKVWEKIEDFSSNISKKIEEMRINKVLLSIIIGVIIAIIILAIIYLVVMR